MRRTRAGVQSINGSSAEKRITPGNLQRAALSIDGRVRESGRQGAMQPQGGMIPTWGQLNRSRERHTEEMHRPGNAQPVNKNNKV